MTDDRVEWHLWNWSVYATIAQEKFEAGHIARDYGSRAAGGIGHSHSNDSDSMVAEIDARCAYVVDLLIGELPEGERIAVRHVHLEAVYRMRNHDALYAMAKLRLRKGLVQRGIE
jgi:hypothetical protein